MRAPPLAAPLALLALAALAGCAGDAPQIGGLSSGVSTESIARGEAYGDPATGAAPKDQVFNPFGTNDGPAPGGREVIEQPTMADVLLAGTLPEMSWGRADAPVTIVEYASLTCPHCRKFHLEVFPELKRTYIDTGKVRFILREFPIGKTSGTATIALRCALPEKYLDLFGKYLTQQTAWVSQEVRHDAIFAVAQQVGMTRTQFDACLQNQGMIDGLKWVKERGRKLGIIGTPNFFIGNKLVKSTLGMKEIRDAVEPLLAGSAATPVPVTR
jgi:protein-disulfide isomerase